MHWYEHAFGDVCRLNIFFYAQLYALYDFVIAMIPCCHDQVVALF